MRDDGRDEGRRSGTRDDGPGRGTTVRDEGRRSGTREEGRVTLDKTHYYIVVKVM